MGGGARAGITGASLRGGITGAFVVGGILGAAAVVSVSGGLSFTLFGMGGTALDACGAACKGK